MVVPYSICDVATSSVVHVTVADDVVTPVVVIAVITGFVVSLSDAVVKVKSPDEPESMLYSTRLSLASFVDHEITALLFVTLPELTPEIVGLTVSMHVV